jgi:hypothetical protein
MFQRNTFLPYRATTKVHFGKLERDIYADEVIETDGYTVKYDGETFTMNTIQVAIAESWFVPLHDQSGRGYVAKPAGVQMHSATPDRNGQRQTIPLNIAMEDHHVVGTVATASLGANSNRTKEMQRTASQLQGQWNNNPQFQQQQFQQQQFQQNNPQMQGMGNHQPIQQSDQRHATQLAQVSQNEAIQTMSGQQAALAAGFGPTKKARDESTRSLITPGNSTGAHSITAAAEQRSQQRQIASRQLAAQQRAQHNMRGQAVGINSLGSHGGSRFQGGDINQQDGQVMRTVNQQQAPAPPGAIPAEMGPGDMALFQQFLQFKAMTEQNAQQGRQGNQAALAQGHAQQYAQQQQQPQQQQPQQQQPQYQQQQYQAPQQQQQYQPPVQQQQYQAPVQQQEAAPAQMAAPPAPVASQVALSPENWAQQTAGVQWARRGKMAVETFGHDPAALNAIASADPSKGVQNAIRKHLEQAG